MYFSPYVVPIVFLALISLVSTVDVLRKPRNIQSNLGAVLILASVEWLVCLMFEVISIGLPMKIFWDSMQYIGICTIPAGWLLFASYFTKTTRWIKPVNVALLFLIPAAVFVLVWTNRFHRLIWTSDRLVEIDSLIVKVSEHGIGQWVFRLYSYFVAAIGVLLFVRHLRRSGNIIRWQTIALVQFRNPPATPVVMF